MLCGINFCFNLIRDVVLVGVSDERNSEDRQQPVRIQRAEALGCFHHASRRPADRGNSYRGGEAAQLAPFLARSQAPSGDRLGS
jgi:hypothetical protein